MRTCIYEHVIFLQNCLRAAISIVAIAFVGTLILAIMEIRFLDLDSVLSLNKELTMGSTADCNFLIIIKPFATVAGRSQTQKEFKIKKPVAMTFPGRANGPSLLGH